MGIYPPCDECEVFLEPEVLVRAIPCPSAYGVLLLGTANECQLPMDLTSKHTLLRKSIKARHSGAPAYSSSPGT